MFNVTKRFGRTENSLSQFVKEEDALHFIQEKLQEDKRYKINASYGLYEGADLLKIFQQEDLPTETESEGSSGSSSSGKGSGQSFSPTPFNTTPRIGPQSFIKDDEEDEGDK